jgi:hypothetical protein
MGVKKITRYTAFFASILFSFGIYANDFGASESTSLKQLKKMSGHDATRQVTRQVHRGQQFHLGLELSSSDLISLNLFHSFGPVIFKYSLTPPIPIDITVNMPKDLISTNNNIRFDHPAYTIDFELTWGPGFTVESYYTPWDLPFYASLGIGARKIRLRGNTSSTLLISDLNNPETTFETATVFGATIDTESTSLLFKAKLGGLLKFNRILFDFGIGLVRPKNISRSVSGSVTVDAPGNSDVSLPAEDLAAIKSEKSHDMESQVLEELKKVDELTLPLVSFALAYEL